MQTRRQDPSPRLLVIRRDNIGDLVCTTPMFRALRSHFPDARICALVNSYNAPVLGHNPDVDNVYAYTKAKHRGKTQSIAGIYRDRLRLIWRLRRERFDYVLLAGPGLQTRGLRFARLARPAHVIGFTEAAKRHTEQLDMGVPYILAQPLHEVEDIFRLLTPLGIEGPPPPLRLTPDPLEVDTVQRLLAERQWAGVAAPIAIHISARKPSNRWPEQNFVALIRRLWARYQVPFVLFWAPGDAANPQHPGDDAKAAAITNALGDIPVLALPTHELGQLIAGLSVCSTVICSDGGAMHIAAALGKPILCFFGKSEATRWHPWGVRYALLQPPSLEADDITVDEAFTAFEQLWQG